MVNERFKLSYLKSIFYSHLQLEAGYYYNECQRFKLSYEALTFALVHLFRPVKLLTLLTWTGQDFFMVQNEALSFVQAHLALRTCNLGPRHVLDSLLARRESSTCLGPRLHVLSARWACTKESASFCTMKKSCPVHVRSVRSLTGRKRWTRAKVRAS